MSASAIGCVCDVTQRGVTIPGSRSTSARIVSNAALPAPTTIAALRVVTGHAARRERVPGLAPAPKVIREIRRVVAEAPEVDELAGAALRRRVAHDRCGPQVALGVVRRAERVNEVVGRVRSVERAGHNGGVRHVAGDPVDAVLRPLGLPRHPDHFVPGECGQQRSPDRPGGAEDRDPHGPPSASSLRK